MNCKLSALPAPCRRAACSLVLAGTLLAPMVASVVPALAEDSSEIRKKVFQRLGSGARHLRTGDAVRAVEDLCWTAERLLNSHDAAWLCGRALLQAREPDRAVEFLLLASDLSPRHLGTWVTLGEAYLSAGQVENSRGAFFKALEIRSDHSPAFDGLARLAQQTGKPARALELFGQALEANPADARARLHRGQMHLQAGRISLALRDIREAARLRPDDGEVQLGLADVLMSSGLTGDALAAARRASELEPGNPRPHALIAEVLVAIGELSEAEKSAREALELDSELARAILALGEVLGRSGRLDQAIEALDIEQVPRISDREYRQVRERREHWIARREQLETLQAQAAAGIASPTGLLTLAEANLTIGKVPRAVELTNRVLDAGLDDEDLLRRAGYIFGAAGRAMDAERALERVVAAGAATATDWFNLGIARELSGDPQGARKAFEACLADAEALAEAHLGLARLAMREAAQQQAIAHLRNFQAAVGEPDSDAAIRVAQALDLLTKAESTTSGGSQ